MRGIVKLAKRAVSAGLNVVLEGVLEAFAAHLAPLRGGLEGRDLEPHIVSGTNRWDVFRKIEE